MLWAVYAQITICLCVCVSVSVSLSLRLSCLCLGRASKSCRGLCVHNLSGAQAAERQAESSTCRRTSSHTDSSSHTSTQWDV